MKNETRKQLNEKEFMEEFIKSSKVWGFGFYVSGISFIALSISILISKDARVLSTSMIMGFILMLIGFYFLVRYERDLF